MKYLSVCSGIEAATVAWHGFGWKPVAFSEIEPFPAAVLEHHYQTVPNLGDLSKYREWPEELLAEVDLLVGGTPCQAFSVAGLRRSLDDERGNLSLTYVNLFHHINEVRKRHGRPPIIALWENVPGCLSTKDNAFGCILGGLLGCDEAPATESGKWDKAGFLGSETVRVGYRVLDAQYFGVAQRRRRVFLVAVPCELIASLGERACPSEILSLRESVLGNPPTRWPQGREASAAAGAGAGERVVGMNAFTKSRLAQSDSDHETWVHGDVAPTFNQFDSGEVRATTVVATSISWWNGDSVSQTLDSVVAKQQAMPEKNRFPAIVVRRGRWKKVSFACECPTGLDGEPLDLCSLCGDEYSSCGCPGPTMDDVEYKERGGSLYGRDAFGDDVSVVRRITPQEVACLQGFPADYLDITFRKKPAADGPKYRALGNSMAVPCMWWLGFRIQKATS